VKKTIGFAFLFLLISTLMGCTSSYMVKASNQDITPPPAGMAQIVFMRSSIVAGAINAELFEVVNGDLKFIGVISNGTKIVYKTTPGEKIFMTYGMAADFMKANVVAGKTYYSIVRPNWGTGGFAPTPIRKQSGKWNMKSTEFTEWLNDTELVIPSSDAKEHYDAKKADFKKIHDEYWARFQNKSPAEVAERTMNPADGR